MVWYTFGIVSSALASNPEVFRVADVLGTEFTKRDQTSRLLPAVEKNCAWSFAWIGFSVLGSALCRGGVVCRTGLAMKYRRYRLHAYLVKVEPVWIGCLDRKHILPASALRRPDARSTSSLLLLLTTYVSYKN